MCKGRTATTDGSRTSYGRKTPEGFNIWNYTVVGERRTRELKGILVEDPEKALGPDLTLPPPNVHVVLVGRAH